MQNKNLVEFAENNSILIFYIFFKCVYSDVTAFVMILVCNYKKYTVKQYVNHLSVLEEMQDKNLVEFAENN